MCADARPPIAWNTWIVMWIVLILIVVAGVLYLAR
jgi:hypothetical protein